MTLDSILNVVIPAGIFIAIIIFIYSKGKKHFDSFFAMIKERFQNISDDDEGGELIKEPSNYRIEYREL